MIYTFYKQYSIFPHPDDIDDGLLGDGVRLEEVIQGPQQPGLARGLEVHPAPGLGLLPRPRGGGGVSGEGEHPRPEQEIEHPLQWIYTRGQRLLEAGLGWARLG